MAHGVVLRDGRADQLVDVVPVRAEDLEQVLHVVPLVEDGAEHTPGVLVGREPMFILTFFYG